MTERIPLDPARRDDKPAPVAWFRPALVKSLRSGYRRSDLIADVQAGALVAVVAIPLSVGLAIASGVSPAQGLMAAVVGGLLISLLGGSRFQVGGPAGAFVGLCASVVAAHGPGGLAVATVMAGAMLVLLGVARLGKAISYIPTPVVIGFTTGIAVIIASTQLAPMFGVTEPERPLPYVHERLHWLGEHLTLATAWAPALCTAITIAIIVAARRFDPRFPGALVAIAAITATSWLAGWDAHLATIGSRFGDLPHGLPDTGISALIAGDWTLTRLADLLRDLSGPALAIALLGGIESLLSAVVADGVTGDRHDSNTELVAQGVGNLASGILAGMPVTGVIARTSTNVRAGARSPVAGIVHAVLIGVAVAVAAPLVLHIPLAALAGVLLVVCWYMADLRHWPHLINAGGGERLLLLTAFGLTIFLDLTWAVVVGVLLAMAFFVRRMAESVSVQRQTNHSEVFSVAPLPAGVEVFDVRGPFFFGAATLIRDLDVDLKVKPRVLILRLRDVPFIDSTAANSLRELASSCRARGGWLLLAEIHTRALHDFHRLGLTEDLGEQILRGSLESALAQAATLMASAPLPRTASAALKVPGPPATS